MWVRLIIGVALVVVGGVWIGQGVGAVRGSFMTGQPVWALIGAIAVVFGIALVVRRNRDRKSPD